MKDALVSGGHWKGHRIKKADEGTETNKKTGISRSQWISDIK